MGNRAIYNIIERGQSNYFYVHWSANALSPLLRLTQAKELQLQFADKPTIAHICEHLDYDGQYQNPRLQDSDMVFEKIDEIAIGDYLKSYQTHGELEMQITLNLDENNCLLEYNKNCPWYQTMGSFSIDIDIGLKNVEKLLAYAEQKGIDDFSTLLQLYNKATGLDSELQKARGNSEIEKYLQSPQVRAERESYFDLYGNQEQEEENDEMEEI